MSRFAIIATAITLVLLFGSQTGNGSSQNCSDILLVFARGSGQNPKNIETDKPEGDKFKEQEPQSYAFFKEVSKRLKNLSVEKISLHDFGGKYNSYGYDAVDVATGMKTKPKHRKDVVNRYYESVADGKDELLGFLRERIGACPYQRIVVGGYSQGAQVVGDAMHELSPYDRTHISYVSLFGDPKYNPRVPGLLLSRASWARGNSASIYSGILGGRSTYLPEDLRFKTSWCDKSDPICSGSRLGDPGLKALLADFLDKTHSNTYQNRWIAHAANDIAIKVTNNTRIDKTIGSVLINDEHPTKKLDVMLVIDSTGYMNYEIRQLQRLPVLQKFVNSVYGQNWDTRVGVVIYNDTDHYTYGSSRWTSEKLQDLTYDRTKVVSAIGKIYPMNMANNDAAMYSGIMTAIKGQAWRGAAQKKIIIISNTKARNPDPGPEKYTEQDVIKAMLNLDPAVGSVINLPDIQTNSRPATNSATSLAAKSNGLLVNGSFATEQTIDTVTLGLEELDASPVAIITDPPEYGDGYIELSAGESYDPDSTIVSYEWDCNDDGVWDFTSDQPTARCAYASPYPGNVFVQVTSSDGQSANGMLGITYGTHPITVQDTTAQDTLDAPVVSNTRLDETSASITVATTYEPGTVLVLQRQDSDDLVEFTGQSYTVTGIAVTEFEYCIYAAYGGAYSGVSCDTVSAYVAPEPELPPVVVEPEPSPMPDPSPTEPPIVVEEPDVPPVTVEDPNKTPKEVTLEESGKFIPDGESDPLANELQNTGDQTNPQVASISAQSTKTTQSTRAPAALEPQAATPVTTVAGIETSAPTSPQTVATVVVHQTPELTVLIVALGLLSAGTLALLWRLNKN